MTEVGFKQAKRRYFRWFWPAMFIYVAVVLGGVYWLKQYETEPLWLQIGVALSSASIVIVSLLVMLRYAFETDEYSRRVQLEGMAIAGVLTTCGIFIAGFLQLFDVIDRIEIFWFGPAFFILHGLAVLARGGRPCL